MDKQQLEVIDLLYKSIHKPESWQLLTQRICEDIGAYAFNLLILDRVYSEIQQSYVSDVAIESFSDYVELGLYQQESALGQTLDITTKGDGLVPIDSVVREHNKLSNTLVDLSEVTHWMETNHGITERFFYSLGNHKAQLDSLHMCMQGNKEVERIVNRCNFYLPHLSNLVNTSRPFMLLQARFNAVLEVLDRFNLAVFLLTKRGEVIEHNEAAYTVINAADSLIVTKNKLLQMIDPDASATFQHHLDKLSQSGGLKKGQRFTLARRATQTDYLCELSAIMHDDIPIGAMLIMSDPEQKQLISTDNFDMLFGLTLSEKEVCQMLAQGLSNRDIAEQRNTSIETTRTQTKAVLSKTGSPRQVDLVRLAYSINLPIDRSE